MKTKKQGEISTILPKIKESRVKYIKADKPDFIPKPFLLANLEKHININPSHFAIVDCGIYVQLDGWQVHLTITQELMCKGVQIRLAETPKEEYKRIKLVVLNLGRQILGVDPMTKLAEISLSPIYNTIWEEVT